MRKTLAVILCALMILPLAFVGISAADPEVITTAEQFAAIKVDGNYKLGADIAVASTLVFKNSEGNEVPFTGTLDGAGHTITVSASLFNLFSGTAKDIVLRGSIDTSATVGHTGALAKTVNGNASFTNILNEASVKGYLTEVSTSYRSATGGIVGIVLKGSVAFKNCENRGEIIGHATGGIVGSYDDPEKNYKKDGYSISFDNCLNTGHVSASQSTKTLRDPANSKYGDAGAAGGILGIGNKVAFSYFTNCKNTGKIEADAACGGPAGGIVGYVYTDIKTDEAGECIITNCENTGEVLSAESQAGGISGWTRLHSVYTGCVNSGFIHSGNNASGEMKGYCGGIAARTSADNNSNTTSSFTNCKNTGKVASGRDQAAGILAYHNSHDVTFTNCENSGVITYDTKPATKVTVAGIFGSHGENKTVGAGVITAIKCLNTGDLVTNDIETESLKKEKYAGGIIGYVWGNAKQYPVVDSCVNKGNINNASLDFSGQFVGYSNTVNVTIKDSVGIGKLTPAEGGYTSIIGCNKINTADMPISGNQIVAGDGTVWFSYAKDAGYDSSKIKIEKAEEAKVKVVSADDAAAAITALGQIGVSGRLGAQGTIGYIAPGAPVVPPVTGDTAVWAVVIAAVSLLGMGIALKARKA